MNEPKKAGRKPGLGPRRVTKSICMLPAAWEAIEAMRWEDRLSASAEMEKLVLAQATKKPWPVRATASLPAAEVGMRDGRQREIRLAALRQGPLDLAPQE